MSTANENNDSDLYGDLYGDDDNEFAVHLDDEFLQTTEQSQSVEEPAAEADTDAETDGSAPTQDATGTASLPAKPQATDAGALSYSAQVAKQFSVYQQTPSQERQQRTDNHNSGAGPSAIATHEGSSVSERPIRPSEMKDEGKMFVGGLNWDTTDEGLKKYFSEFGKVDACTIMRDPDGRSRGFAFLTFEEAESVNAVMIREHYLDGKAIDPKRAIPREEHLRNTRYFVGGLAPTSTAESMREFFAQFGKVVDTTVMIDRESGRSKGFGFVTFEDSNNADRFVGKIGLVLDEKQIEVKMAQPRSQREQGRNNNHNNTRQQDPYFNDRESRTPPTPSMPFVAPQQPNPGANMMYQRMMGQMPMMGGAGGMPNMGMNPMAMGMGGMGMGNYGQMGMGMGGMNMMGGGMNPMGMMNPMAGMRMNMGGPMGAMGMVPAGMGAAGGAAMGMNNMGMRMRQGMGGMPGGVINPNFPRMMNAGPGPARMSNRGQHNFHPYAR